MARLTHIYGGALVTVFGLSLVNVSLGISVGGLFLVWLGLVWVKE